MRHLFIGLVLSSAAAPLFAQTINEAITEAQNTHMNAASGTPQTAPADAPQTVGGFFGGLLKKAGSAVNGGGGTPGKRLKDTPVYKLFERFPVTDSRVEPEYPKVAISMSYPGWLNEGSPTIGQFKANQCISYSLTHWANATTRQTYDNLVVCAGDIPQVSHTGLRAVWPQFGTNGNNTGQLRTTGPVPPAVPFPSDPASQKFMERGGVFFLGAVLSGLGFDWNYVGDKRRVWVVKVGDLGPASQGGNGDTAAAAATGGGLGALFGRGQGGAGNGGVSAQCRADNFTGERFGKIAQGMSFEAVKQAIGCEPDSDFTSRSGDSVMYKWTVTINNHVAAKSIDVFFDGSGTKVKGAGNKFKFSNGF